MEGIARLGTDNQFLRYVDDLAYVSEMKFCDTDASLFVILSRYSPSQSRLAGWYVVESHPTHAVGSVVRECIVPSDGGTGTFEASRGSNPRVLTGQWGWCAGALWELHLTIVTWRLLSLACLIGAGRNGTSGIHAANTVMLFEKGKTSCLSRSSSISPATEYRRRCIYL